MIRTLNQPFQKRVLVLHSNLERNHHSSVTFVSYSPDNILNYNYMKAAFSSQNATLSDVCSSLSLFEV